jgi:hypothetical protein
VGRVELVEPGVERSHPLTTVEFVGHGALCQGGDVQLGATGLVVEIVGKADVPACHTQRIHTECSTDAAPEPHGGRFETNHRDVTRGSLRPAEWPSGAPRRRRNGFHT